jgi:hypothetical protein
MAAATSPILREVCRAQDRGEVGRLKPIAFRHVTPPPCSAKAAGGGNSTRNHDSQAEVEASLILAQYGTG